MSDERIRRLVRWNSVDVLAVLSQTSARIEEYLREGKTVGVVVCIVSCNEDGAEKLFEPAFSRMPVECVLWAANKIERQGVSCAETLDG